MHIDPKQWKRLKKYWSGEVVMKKSQMMTTARQQVQNVSKLGRRGKALLVSSIVDSVLLFYEVR